MPINKAIALHTELGAKLQALEKLRNPAQLRVTVSTGVNSEGEEPDAVVVELSCKADLDGFIDKLKDEINKSRSVWYQAAEKEYQELKGFLGENA